MPLTSNSDEGPHSGLWNMAPPAATWQEEAQVTQLRKAGVAELYGKLTAKDNTQHGGEERADKVSFLLNRLF